jgi:nucleoside-diphosphate-sugar epimerase
MHNNQLKEIVVAGATGLVGSKLMEMLLADVTVHKLIVLSRSEVEWKHIKVQCIITDFDRLDQYVSRVSNAHALFCCIGTTIKRAGSKEAFKKVDYQIPLNLAGLAQKARINKFIVISSLGADPQSGNFYLKTKGEMEKDITVNYSFQKLAFLRPSLLLGPRTEFRLGERFAQLFLYLFSFLMIGRLKKYKPITDYKVAKAMISISNSINNQKVYEAEELMYLGS